VKTVMMTRPLLVGIYFYLILFSAFSTEAFGKEPMLSKGQTLWVPLYSKFTTRMVSKKDFPWSETAKHEVALQLTTNLVIHNTDLKHPITIVKADYYNSNGKLLKSFVSEPLEIKPMAATHFFIRIEEKSEDWGTIVLIRWQSDFMVNEPIVDSVTFSFLGNKSILIKNQSKPIKE